MLDLLYEICHRGTLPVRLNTSFRFDLALWQTFTSTWNDRLAGMVMPGFNYYQLSLQSGGDIVQCSKQHFFRLQT